MAALSRGNGTNFDWLRKPCDISTCDLSPDRNPEKYGRPMKSAIPGWCLLIPSLPGSALRTHVESLAKPRDVNKRFSWPCLVNLISKDTHHLGYMEFR